MRLLLAALATAVVFSNTAWAADGPTDESVIQRVEQTAEDIAKDCKGTFDKIIGKEHPYTDKDDPSFYVFVYDKDVNMVAHPKGHLVGKNYKGKPDVKGNKFRDAIVEGALADGSGWTDYVYQKPGEKGIHEKKAYYKLVTGDDGNEYVVVCGVYK